MKQLVAILVLLALSASISEVTAQEITRLQGDNFGELMREADQLADRVDGEVWIGYTIRRRMYHKSRMGWYSQSDNIVLGDLLQARMPSVTEVARQTLRELRDEEEDRLISKEVAILIRRRPGRHDEMRTVTLDAPARLGSSPLIWLGEVDNAESLEHLLGSRNTLDDEDLVSAVGMHDLPEQTVPWLLGVARNHRDGDVRESAQYWIAAGLVAAMNLRRETRNRTDYDKVRRSALFALVSSLEEEAVEVLVGLVEGGGDAFLRHEALLQLGYLDDNPDALRALEDFAISVNLGRTRR